MGLSLPLALALVAAVILLYVGIRQAWIAWQLNLHTTFASYWARRTRQGAVVLDEALTIWPFWDVMLHPSWSWRHFTVHPDLYDEVMTFVRAESRRSDLNWETYAAEAREDQERHEAEALVAAQVDEPAATTAQPAAPSTTSTTPSL